MDVDKMDYGNYKFTVEIDTGSETGDNQLTVWVAEKMKVNSWLLSRFKPDQLFNALLEPQRSRLLLLLDTEKRACRPPFEDEMQKLRQLFTTTTNKGKKKLPGKVKRQIGDLRRQMQEAVRKIEAEFAQRELLTLDRQCFDWDILQKESRAFEESRHLRKCNHWVKYFLDCLHIVSCHLLRAGFWPSTR
jgi:hypothetical protein